MPPQMMAHGGMVDGATQSEKDALLSIWDKMTPEQKEQMMNKSSESDRERKFWDAYEANPDSFAKDAQYYDILQKDRQSAGDLIGYANGGHVNVGQRLGPLMSPDDLLRRTFPQLYPVPVSPDQQIVDSAIDQLMANQPNRLDEINKKYEDIKQEKLETTGIEFKPPVRDPEPLTVMGKDQVGGGISGIDPDDIPNAGNLDIDAEGNIIKPNENNYPDLEETLTERAKARGAILPGIISGVKDIGQKTVKGYLDLVGPEILASEGLDPNLYDPDWVDLVSPEDKKPTEIQDDKEPTETQVLTEIQEQSATGGLPPNTYYDPVNDMIIDKATGKEFDGLPKGPITNITSDGTNVTGTPSTVQSSTTGRALQDDALLAEQQRLDELKEQIFKGNMDRKWMAIAAGAFNAAQKGAPTLMQGLADLGGGVTQELQKMDKEDQDRAMALYEIYLQEATLAESKRKTDLTYQAAMYGHDLDSLKNIADRVGKNAKDVLDATKAFNTAQKNKTLGDFGTEQYVGALIDYADMGVTSAALEYNQEVGKLNAKEKEILSDIEDFDPNNPDHIKEAREEMTEYLNDNPSMKLLYNDYWSKRATQDEKGKTIPFDISSSLIIRPPTG
jgi:hypothetical protein